MVNYDKKLFENTLSIEIEMLSMNENDRDNHRLL